MPSLLVAVDPNHPHARSVERVAQAVRAGGLIAHPTGTGYGLGCDLRSKRAIDRLYALKHRDRKKPFAILCPDLSDVARYALVSKFAYRTMRHLAPGPFTFVLEATRLVPEMMTTRQKQVGIRIPALPWVQALLGVLGGPLVNSSAAEIGQAAVLDAHELKAMFGHALELIIDAGAQPTDPSTVISLIADQIEVLRQGKGALPLI